MLNKKKNIFFCSKHYLSILLYVRDNVSKLKLNVENVATEDEYGSGLDTYTGWIDSLKLEDIIIGLTVRFSFHYPASEKKNAVNLWSGRKVIVIKKHVMFSVGWLY